MKFTADKRENDANDCVKYVPIFDTDVNLAPDFIKKINNIVHLYFVCPCCLYLFAPYFLLRG